MLLSKDRLTVVEKFICPDEKRVWAERVRLPRSIEEIEEPVVADTGAVLHRLRGMNIPNMHPRMNIDPYPTCKMAYYSRGKAMIGMWLWI